MATPEPYEGITGTDRSGDWLLSLDERAVAHREALMAMARHLHSATLVGNPAPIVAEMYRRITNPQPGDLVMETSSYHRRTTPADRSGMLGYLVATRIEWATTLAEHEAMLAKERKEAAEHGYPCVPSERHTDQITYIQYGPTPGDVCRWWNCAFIAIPIDRDAFRRPVSNVITRDSLAEILGASGFELR